MSEQTPTTSDATAARSGEILTLRGLTVARGGRDVVRDVTIEIPPGEVTALLGPTAPASPAWSWPSAACCR